MHWDGSGKATMGFSSGVYEILTFALSPDAVTYILIATTMIGSARRCRT